MSEGNNQRKRGRPQKYVFWSDFQNFLLKEWYPFKANDFAHLQTDVSWLKKIMIGILIAIIWGAIAVILTG